jgi:hypothetical protein
MDLNIGPYTDQLIKSVSNEVKKKETRDKICNLIIYPLINEVSEKYKIKIQMLTIIVFLLIILLISTLIVGVMNYNCINKQV